MAWDIDRMNVWGNGLTVIADAVLVMAALAEQDEKRDKAESKALDSDSVDLLGNVIVLVADTLLAIAAIAEVNATRRGLDPPDTSGIENLGNWGSLLGDALAIVAFNMASAD